MPGPAKSLIFGPFRFDLGQRVLLRDGKHVPLTPKAILILSILVENHGNLVEREYLMDKVWPGVNVEEGNLSVNIFALRKLLSQGRSDLDVIETVPKRGYRFIMPVEELLDVDAGAPEPEKPEPDLDKASATGAAESPPASEDYIVFGKPGMPAKLLLVTVLAALVLVLLGWAYLGQPAPPRVLHVVRLTHMGQIGGVLTDGTRLYLTENKGGVSLIAQTPLDGGDLVPIPTPFRNTWAMDVSASQAQLLVLSFESRGDPKQLWTLPLTGGSPRRVGDVKAKSARWSPDGAMIAFEGEDGILYVVNSDGSEVRKLADPGGGVDCWSPDSRHVRFTRTNQAKGGKSIWEVEIDGTHLQPVLPERQNPEARWGEGQSRSTWTPDGNYYLFCESFHSRTGIWAVQEKRGFWPFRQEPTEVYAAPSDFGNYVVEPGGRRIYLISGGATEEVVRYDPGLRQFVPVQPALPGGPIWSPDRKSIAYVDSNDYLWKANADGSEHVQLTFPPLQAFGFAWSPNGRRLLFHSLSPGQTGKNSIVSAEGGSVQTLFAQEPTGENCPSWSADGTSVLFDRTWLDKSGNATASAIFTWDMKAQHLAQLPGSENLMCPAWSPDQKYIVAHSDNYHELRLIDLKTGVWAVIARGGYLNGAAWTRDSKWVYYQDTFDSKNQPLYRVSVPEGKAEMVAGRPQLLRNDVSRYRFYGLDPQDNPLAVVIRENSDVYALDLSVK